MCGDLKKDPKHHHLREPTVISWSTSASSLLFFFMSRKKAVDSSRSCEGRKPGKTFFSTISSSDQICQYLMPHTSSITYLITFLTSIFLHIEAGCPRLSLLRYWHFDKYILFIIKLSVLVTKLLRREPPLGISNDLGFVRSVVRTPPAATRGHSAV